MHPKEVKRTRCNTGRLTHLNLENSEIIIGDSFDSNARVNALIQDSTNLCVLVYPKQGSFNLSKGEFPRELIQDKQLVVFLIDSTWACSKGMINKSECLKKLPCVLFTPSVKSRYVIKKQPSEFCLSTLEAIHELLLALSASGLDTYPDPERLINVFHSMQDVQIDAYNSKRTLRYRKKTMERIAEANLKDS